MKQLSSLLSLVAVSLLSATPLCNAQDEKPKAPQGGRGDRLAMMKESLGLSPEQVEKLKPIFEANTAKGKAIIDDAALQPEEKRAKMREIFTASQPQIEAVLTPEQLTKWKEERAKMAERRKAAEQK